MNFRDPGKLLGALSNLYNLEANLYEGKFSVTGLGYLAISEMMCLVSTRVVCVCRNLSFSICNDCLLIAPWDLASVFPIFFITCAEIWI